MTESDLRFIENKLSIRLPEAYCKIICPFPVRAYTGNSDTPLWDDSAGLIELNLRLRSERGWRPSLFAVGETNDGSKTAIDLSTPELEIWWIDRSIRSQGSGSTKQSFSDWSAELLRQMRSGEYLDGFDPENDPPATRTRTKPFTFWTVLGCVGAIVAIAVVVALIIFCVQLLFGWV